MKNIALLYFMNKHKKFFDSVEEKINNDLNNYGTTKQIENALMSYSVKQLNHNKNENKVVIDFFNPKLLIKFNYIINEDESISYRNFSVECSNFILNENYIFLSKPIFVNEEEKYIDAEINFSKNDIRFKENGETIFKLKTLTESKEIEYFSKMNEDVFSYLCGNKLSIGKVKEHADILNLMSDSISFNKVLNEKKFFGIYKIIDESFNKIKSTKSKVKSPS